MNAHASTMEDYYRKSDDPWGFRTRWYERRKRNLLVACLPEERYTKAWEIGCSNGELAGALAPRCQELLASDGNATALAAADQRLAEFPSASTAQLWIPEQWPSGKFDLIVLSEMAYYLDRSELEATCVRLTSTLAPGGTFVACHWRPQIEGCVFAGDEIHEIMSRLLPWKKSLQHLETDFRLEVWQDEANSLAKRGGLR